MTPKAMAQRQAASVIARDHATGPRTEAGKAACSRNAWKHGLTSAVNRQAFGHGQTALAKLFGRPCLTTCPYHPDNPQRTEAPCSLVLDGLTRAGGSCLDKTVYTTAFGAIMDAMQSGELDGMQGLLASELAQSLQILHEVRKGIAEHGVISAIPLTSKDGKVITKPDGAPYVAEYALNPLLAVMAKLQDVLGINLAEAMVTPKSAAAANAGEEAASAIQQLLGGALSRVNAARRLPQPSDSDA